MGKRLASFLAGLWVLPIVVSDARTGPRPAGVLDAADVIQGRYPLTTLWLCDSVAGLEGLDPSYT